MHTLNYHRKASSIDIPRISILFIYEGCDEVSVETPTLNKIRDRGFCLQGRQRGATRSAKDLGCVSPLLDSIRNKACIAVAEAPDNKLIRTTVGNANRFGWDNDAHDFARSGNMYESQLTGRQTAVKGPGTVTLY